MRTYLSLSLGWILILLLCAHPGSALPGAPTTASRSVDISPATEPSGQDGQETEFQQRLQQMLKADGLSGKSMDLSYASVVALALQRNLKLLSASYEVPIAQARYDQAEAARNPTLYHNFFYEHQARNLLAQNLPNTRYVLLGAGYTLTQATLYVLGENQMLDRTTLFIPVYTGGRLESAMHLQAALAEASKYGYERQRQQLVYETKSQYLITLLARENVRVAEKVLAQAEEVAGYARSRLNAGVGTKLDVLQAEVAMANAQDAVVRTKTSSEKADADLAGVLDLPLLTEFIIHETLPGGELLEGEPVPGQDLKALAELALGQRPELSELRQRLVANHEQENVARSDLLPQLGLNLNYDIIGNPDRLGGGFSMMATLSIPIYDGGVASARIQEFQLRDLQLKNDELKLVQDISLEVHRASLDLKEADARLESAQAAQRSAAEALRIASLRYQVGAGTSLELVTAQTVLANAEFALAEARYRQLLVRATLNFALGQPVASASPEPSLTPEQPRREE